MEREQLLKGNKLIADFMGWKHHDDKDYDSHEMANLKYHTSWDALMPVVELLHDKGVDVWINYKNCKIEWMDSDNSYEKPYGTQGETKILSVWLAIIYFIEWVNENKIDLDNPVFYE